MPRPLDAPGSHQWRPAIPAPLLALAGALLTGLLLRLWGIQWGFPRVDLSPDELNVWNISARLRWSDLDTHFYNYSGLTFYLNFFAAQAARLFGVVLLPHTILLVNRLWSVFFGTLTIGLAYLAARDLFEDKRAGAWAAWCIALLPIHAWHSHFGTSDVGLAFWISAVFWLALRAYRIPETKRFLLAGLAVGIAVGVKFNGLLAAVFLPIAALAAWREKRVQRPAALWRMLLVAAAAALAGFFIVSPFSLLHLRETIDAYFFETRHVKGGHYGFDLSPDGWPYFPYVYQLFAAFPFSFGLPLYLAVGASLIHFAFRARKMLALLCFSFPLLYLGIVASWKFVPTRYYLPALPILLVLASGGFRSAVSATGSIRRSAAWMAALAVLAYTLAFSVSTVDRFRRDTRLQAADWAEQALPAGTRIILVDPIFDRGYIVPAGSPGPMPFPVSLERVMEKSYMPLFNRSGHAVQAFDLSRTVNEWRNGRIGRGDVVCLSSLVFLRDVRLGRKAAGRMQLWNFIRNNPRRFRRWRVFDAPFLHRAFYAALDPMYACDFVSPTIEFYEPLPRRGARPPTPATAAPNQLR